MLKRIFKYTALAFFFGMILFVSLYRVYPKATYNLVKDTVVYKTAINSVVSVLKYIAPKEGYDNKYGVHPYLLQKVARVISDAKQRGIDLRVISGFRDMKKQQMLYNKGRTKKGYIVTNAPPGLSYHNHGWAVDVCEYKNGKPYWGSKRWNEIGAIGKQHGLVWGGDWKSLVDKPHLQLSLYDIILLPFRNTEKKHN